MSLKQRRIVLAISGGIAAYKAAALCRELGRRGAQVHVVMTANATQFVKPLTFAALTQYPVCETLFDAKDSWGMDHIGQARWGDLLIVAPASANVIGKFANGIADDALSTLYLAWDRPVLLAPAMNPTMWGHPAVRSNFAQLRKRGVHAIGPESGDTACGELGEGRMAEPDVIADAAEKLLGSTERRLQDRKVLITTGPTREYLDPVRFISNPSSGKMGYALAQEAAAQGATVTLISGPTALSCPTGVQRIDVETAEEMFAAIQPIWESQDLLVLSAAVGDYTPEQRSNQKIKKEGEKLSLKLRKTVDIAQAIGEQCANRKHRPVLVGFAAETHEVESHARKKLKKKHLDLIVANNVSQTGGVFGSEENQAVLIDKNGKEQALPRQTKQQLATCIFAAIESFLK